VPVISFSIFEPMKANKQLFGFALFLLTVFTYAGHGMHDYFDLVADKVENTAPENLAHGSVYFETSQEDETHSILPGNQFLIENNGCTHFAAPGSLILPKIDFTIWLPPES
jgi:hypothetical protein